MSNIRVGDTVAVCETYRQFSGQRPKVNGKVLKVDDKHSMDALVQFPGWDDGHGFDSSDWFIPLYHLTSLICLPDETAAPTEPVVVKLHPSDMIILKHLKARGSISMMEALVSHGCPRLAPRIFNLRAAGHSIRTELLNDESGHRYSRYVLEG